MGSTGTISAGIATLPVGTSTFTLVAQVAPSVPGGAVISNVATVTGTTADPNGANDSATANTSVIGLGGLVPAALIVDGWAGAATVSDLNQVLEPGETVVVRP